MTTTTRSGTVLLMLLAGCSVTTHPTQPSTLGTVRSTDELLAVLDQPGPIELETVTSADWAVDRGGLINLSHPAAKELKDGPEPIQVFFHVLKHPTQGTFLVDTGLERALRDAPEKSALSGAVRGAMKMDQLKVHVAMGDWVETNPRLDGVFFTHLHLDHLAGVPDLPATTPLFTGPGEAGSSHLKNIVIQDSSDRALKGKPALSEWQFQGDAAGVFEGVLDVFGDGSVWALLVPGHTSGSTAYLVRSTRGPVLLVGDTCHTRWGWEHAVEPGSFTDDGARNAASLARLKQFVDAHPAVEPRFGHQR